MKKIILLLLVIFVVFLLINRQKVFVRDPLATLTRDGVKESGAQVYINYSNEVLLENDNAPAYLLLVQANDHIGSPALPLKCIHWMACMTDADRATIHPEPPSVKIIGLASKVIEFRDNMGRDVQVTLR